VVSKVLFAVKTSAWQIEAVKPKSNEQTDFIENWNISKWRSIVIGLSFRN
jgi:hypothetical protein